MTLNELIRIAKDNGYQVMVWLESNRVDILKDDYSFAVVSRKFGRVKFNFAKFLPDQDVIEAIIEFSRTKPKKRGYRKNE